MCDKSTLLNFMVETHVKTGGRHHSFDCEGTGMQGTDHRNLVREVRNFVSTKGVTLAPPHQLSSKDADLHPDTPVVKLYEAWRDGEIQPFKNDHNQVKRLILNQIHQRAPKLSEVYTYSNLQRTETASGKLTMSWPSVSSYEDLVDQEESGSYHVVDATADGVEEGVSALYTWVDDQCPEHGKWVRVCCFRSDGVSLPPNMCRIEPTDPYQIKQFVRSYIG